MEQVLDIYEKPYDPQYPVVCFDERPCQLIDDIITPLPPEPKRPKKVDHQYKRNGTAVVLMAVEPLAGQRSVQVTERRTKKEYAEFMENLVKLYPDAIKITLVQDNLNTHHASSFYENMDPKTAFELSQRFNFVYTPKNASWLNMAEIELSALSKQCLDRRIGNPDTLKSEVEIWSQKRNKDQIKIHWQFTNTKAREKLKRHYGAVLKT